MSDTSDTPTTDALLARIAELEAQVAANTPAAIAAQADATVAMIDAQADATVAQIEAQADADVKVAEAIADIQADAAPDDTPAGDGDDITDDVGDVLDDHPPHVSPTADHWLFRPFGRR